MKFCRELLYHSAFVFPRLSCSRNHPVVKGWVRCFSVSKKPLRCSELWASTAGTSFLQSRIPRDSGTTAHSSSYSWKDTGLFPILEYWKLNLYKVVCEKDFSFLYDNNPGHMIGVYLTLRNCQLLFWSRCPTLPSSMSEDSVAPCPHPHVLLSAFFLLIILTGD